MAGIVGWFVPQDSRRFQGSDPPAHAERTAEIFGGYALASELGLERNMSWAILYRAGERTAKVRRMLIAEGALAFGNLARPVPTPPPLEERVS